MSCFFDNCETTKIAATVRSFLYQKVNKAKKKIQNLVVASVFLKMDSDIHLWIVVQWSS